MTVWLSWTHTWHKANKNNFFMLSSITETTCFSLNGHSVVQLKMLVRYTMKFDTPKSPSASLSPVCSLSLFLSLTRSLALSLSLCKAMTFKVTPNFLVAQASELNFWMLLPSPNTIRQLSFICAIRPVSASVKASLPNSHTVMNDKPLASKVVFWQMLQRLPRRGFHSFIVVFYYCYFSN